MRPWEGVPPSLLPSVVGTPFFLIALLLVSVVLIFAGRRAIRIVAFILGGFVGAYFGGIFGGAYLGSFGTIFGDIIGFLLGGILSLVFLSVAIGLGLGYAGYAVTQGILGVGAISLVIGVALFILGVILSGKILSVVSVFIGSFLLLNALTFAGVQIQFALPIVVVLALLGLWVQNESMRQRIRSQGA